jgi:ABC-type polar amino acid transport system ATPase subunit
MLMTEVRVPREPLVQIEDVRKNFGVLEVLRGVSFSAEKGSVLCIIGASGSGKSTLLRCINRLETPSTGRIVVDGVEVTAPRVDLPLIRRQIGMVFQAFNLFPHLTVLENVIEGPRTVLGMSKRHAMERGRALLARVGLAEKADERPGKLSGGQKQRVAIARALAMEPKLLLFDEPTSALDPELVNEVLGVMTQLAREGRTMIIVTHEIHFADQVAHRVLMLDEGRIIEEGPPSVVLHRAQHARTRTFLQQLEH